VLRSDGVEIRGRNQDSIDHERDRKVKDQQQDKRNNPTWAPIDVLEGSCPGDHNPGEPFRVGLAPLLLLVSDSLFH